MLQPEDSPCRMANVCKQIPDTLGSLDVEITGYHKECYRKFINHQERLKECSHESSRTRDPRTASACPLFPAKCIICDKAEMKVKGSRKTERCMKFSVFKEKETGALQDPGWKSIAPRALELGLDALYRRVLNEDLFAREAQFHRSCLQRFHLQYKNYVRSKTQCP